MDKITKGGSWAFDAQRARAAYRVGGHPGHRPLDLGFRPILRPNHERVVRVVRGGCWSINASSCRPACRYHFGPGFRFLVLGFRLVLRCTK